MNKGGFRFSKKERKLSFPPSTPKKKPLGKELTKAVAGVGASPFINLLVSATFQMLQGDSEIF